MPGSRHGSSRIPWDEWHPEMPWMSLYFSVCVWCSLALVHVPQSQDAEITNQGSAVLTPGS